MTRQKSQRPTVYATGTREKLWKVEYREYFIGPDGKERSHHKSQTWSRADHTKAEAQALADKMLMDLRQGPPKADGAMTLAEFWRHIYLPIRRRQWTGHTQLNAECLFRNHIEPQLGKTPLREITKAMIQLHLGRLVDAGLGEVMVDSVRARLNSMMEEAVDNDYITKNPVRKIEIPPCKPSLETRSLTEAEVQRLWDCTEGRDYLVWRVLVLTGARIGEVWALTRDDVLPDGLLIDETVVHGAVKLPGGGALKTPKGGKVRLAVLPESLRSELDEWLKSHDSRLIFPAPHGQVYRRSSREVLDILARGRAVGIPDLQYRMCRTTFASLFEGDEADRTSIMGHHSTRFTLERYRKPIQVRRQRSVEELDHRLRGIKPPVPDPE